jgi:hypothetical protein
MRSYVSSVSLLFALAIAGSITSGCGGGKGYRQVVIVNGEKAEVLTHLEGGAPPGQQEIWVSGRIILFRTSTVIPSPSGGVTGVAGHVYRVNDGLRLDDLGEFDLNLSNNALLQKYGT